METIAIIVLAITCCTLGYFIGSQLATDKFFKYYKRYPERLKDDYFDRFNKYND